MVSSNQWVRPSGQYTEPVGNKNDLYNYECPLPLKFKKGFFAIAKDMGVAGVIGSSNVYNDHISTWVKHPTNFYWDAYAIGVI